MKRTLAAIFLCASAALAGCRAAGGTWDSPALASADAEELWIVVRDGQRPPAWSADELAASGLSGTDAAGRTLHVAPAEHTLEVDVLGRLAVLGVRQRYAALDVALVEAELVWPLPAQAVPTDFVLELGERRIRGVVREREDAERLYAAARAQGRNATWIRAEDGVFRQRFANLPARVPLVLTLDAFHDLPWVDGWCELDLALCGTPSTRLALDVRIDAGVDAAAFELDGLAAEVERGDARSARLRYAGASPAGAARLRYRVDGTRAQQAWCVRPDADGATFCLLAYPPAVDGPAPALSIDWPAARPASLFTYGGEPAGTPVVVLGRLAAGAADVERAPACRWGSAGAASAARRIDVPDGPLGRALTKAWARSALLELEREGLAGLDPSEVDERLRAYRELALEHGLVTFCTALVLVDARSGGPP